MFMMLFEGKGNVLLLIMIVDMMIGIDEFKKCLRK